MRFGFCYESSTTFSNREFVANVLNSSKLLPRYELQELTMDCTIQLISFRTGYISAMNLKKCRFVAIRGIRGLCGIEV